MNIFLFIPFILLLLFSFYIPGLFILDFLYIPFSKFEKFISAWIIGISIFILGTYLLAWINCRYVYVILLIFITIFYFRRKNYHKILLEIKANINILKKIKFTTLVPFLIILFGSISYILISYFSAFKVYGGEQFIGQNFTDGIFHLANVKNFLIYFPPHHTGLAGYPLRGYHYFYDFLLSSFASFYYFTPEDLYYRLFPTFIVFLYGLSFYLLSLKLNLNKHATCFVVFFAYFFQSLEPFFRLAHYPLNSTIPLSLSFIIDPSIILSVSLMIFAICELPKTKDSLPYAILIGTVIGIESQLKVYAGILLLLSSSLYIIYRFLKKEQRIKNNILTMIVATLTTFLTFFPNNFGAGALIFYPFLFYENFMFQPDLKNLHWGVLEYIYMMHHNIIRIIQIYLEAFVFFWLVNLGVKILLLLGIKKLLFKNFWINDINFLLLITIFFSIFIPTFFIQSIVVFDTKQFMWIGLILLGIPVAAVIGMYLQKIYFIFQIVIIVVIIWFSTGDNIMFVKSYLFSTPVIISNDQTAVYNRIAAIVPKNGFVVVIPKIVVSHHKKILTITTQPMVSALSGRSVYYEGENNPFAGLQLVYDFREKQLEKLNNYIETCDENNITNELTTIGTKYIVTFKNETCLNNSSFVSSKFSANNLYFYILKTS